MKVTNNNLRKVSPGGASHGGALTKRKMSSVNGFLKKKFKKIKKIFFPWGLFGNHGKKIKFHS